MLLFAIIIFAYVIMLITFCYGWNCLYKKRSVWHSESVSIVVAARNEAKHIVTLIESVERQTYKSCQLVIVNDHSIDATLMVINDYIAKNELSIPIVVYDLPDDVWGKKSAVQYAIQQISSDVIITTDADCRMSSRWVASMLDYLTNGVDMVVGPVVFERGSGILNSVFALEFMSLVGSGAATIGLGHSIFCNAANLCYRRNIITPDLNLKMNIVSGDDVFLLHSVKQSRGIAFAKISDAVVETEAPSSLKQFFNQRVRWASKTTSYTDVDSIMVALIVLLANIVIFVLLVYCAIAGFTKICVLLLLIKTLSDFVFLAKVCRFFGQTTLLWYVVPLEIFYSMYIAFTGIYSIFAPIKWKGRRYSR